MSGHTDQEFSVVTLPDGVVKVVGELDAVNSPALSSRLAAEDCPLLLDLSDVTFMNAAVVHVFLEHRERCTERGEEFRIVAASDVVRRVLELSGMAAMFAIADR